MYENNTFSAIENTFCFCVHVNARPCKSFTVLRRVRNCQRYYYYYYQRIGSVSAPIPKLEKNKCEKLQRSFCSNYA